MPEQKKHIDDFFREKMGGHTEAPPSFVWKTLEQKLDSTVTPATVVSYYKWLRYGVILSLLVVLVYFSGRKLMDTSDVKQLATAEGVSSGTSQNNTGVTAGNAVAGTNANTTANGTADNKRVQAGENATTNTQAQVTQTNIAQATGTPVQNIQQVSNTQVQNNGTQAANSSVTTTAASTVAKTLNNKSLAVNSNKTALVGHDGRAIDNKLAAANNNAIGGGKNISAPGKNSNYSTALAANSNAVAISQAPKSGSRNSVMPAAKTQNAEAGNLTKANAKNSGVMSTSSNKSNLHAYAGKGKKIEYSQNSFRNDIAGNNVKQAKSNIVANTGNNEATAGKNNSSTENTNHNIAAKQADNNAASPVAKNNAGQTEDNNSTAAGSSELQSGVAATVLEQSNKQTPAATNNTVGGNAKNNTAQAGSNANIVGSKNNLQPANSQQLSANNTAVANANNIAANKQPVSSMDFLNDLKEKEAAEAAQKKMRTQPSMETGIKLGYEMGFQHHAANKYVVAPYVQYNVGRFGMSIEPALKFAQNTHSASLGNSENYFSVTDPAYFVQLYDTVNTNNNVRTRAYSYSETHDSIVVGHHIQTKSYTEIEVPVLLKYKVTKNAWVYGGVLLNYSNAVIQIATDKHVYSREGNYVYRDSFDANSTKPIVPDPSSVFHYSGIAYASYTNAGYENANSMKLRTGYMFGASYTIKDKFMIDVSVQQNLSNMNYVPNADVRSIYTQPYVRISAGYKLFKSKQKEPKNYKKHQQP